MQARKKLGVVYTFVDSGAEITGAASLSGNDLVQGTYQSGSNQMVIALNASESSLLSVAGHETLHYVKEWAGQNETSRAMYEEFQTFVLDKLQAVEDYDLEGRIADKQAQYKRAGQELTRDAAIEEIVADSMTMVFATDENVQEFLESHDQTLTEKIVNVIKRLVSEIKAAIQRIAKGNAEAAAMLKQDADTLQEISDRFDRLAVVARGVRESMQAAGQRQETQADAEPDDLRYSIRNELITPDSTETERYEILKNAVINVASVNPDKLADVDLEFYNTRKKSTVEKGIKTLAQHLGIMNVDFENSYIEFPFKFTNKNLSKSLHHQLDYGGTYQDYVKAISCFEAIVNHAFLLKRITTKRREQPKLNPD